MPSVPTTATTPATPATTATAPTTRGSFAAPWSARTWRETLHNLLSLPVGILGFVWVTATVSVGIGSVLSVVGLPVLAVAVLGARGLGAMERARVRALLGTEVPAPAAPEPRRPGAPAWIAAMLRSPASWKAALYQLVMLPIGILSFTVAVVFWSYALAVSSYPLWHWTVTRYAHLPGLQLYTNGGHTVYLDSPFRIAATCLLGLVLLWLTPQLMRGLAALQRALARGLLSA
jgi:hypothetical protein